MVQKNSADNPLQIYNALIGIIQEDFPITPHPFQTLAGRLGSDEKTVINDILRLAETGLIRSIGPVFEARKLGYISTLVAVKIQQDRVAELAAAMLDVKEITHNYLRNNEINLWFTITAANKTILENLIKWVEKFPGVEEVYNMPAKQVFKINAVWNSARSAAKKTSTKQNKKNDSNSAATFPIRDKKLVRALQNKFPIVQNPFKVIASSIGSDEEDVIRTVARWVETGVIRRFGARLNHKKLGYTVNYLVAWEASDIVRIGEKFAEYEWVSHCYLRDSHLKWPYELYTMVHARTEHEASRHIKTMNEAARGARMQKLKTLYELKKTSMKYFMEE